MKKRVRRDIEFYGRVAGLFDFAGRPIPEIPYDKDGPDAAVCFHVFDSTGRLIPTSQPATAAQLIITKASVNLHIKMWAQGIRMGLFSVDEFKEFLAPYSPPDWIWKAIDGQLTAGNNLL